MAQTYDMTKVHEANLKILKELDRICRKYKIRYALDAGTLIGAVRHKGFIPWDDDADVVLIRSQYEVLKKVIKGNFPIPWSFWSRTATGAAGHFMTLLPVLFIKTARFIRTATGWTIMRES